MDAPLESDTISARSDARSAAVAGEDAAILQTAGQRQADVLQAAGIREADVLQATGLRDAEILAEAGKRDAAILTSEGQRTNHTRTGGVTPNAVGR